MKHANTRGFRYLHVHSPLSLQGKEGRKPCTDRLANCIYDGLINESDCIEQLPFTRCLHGVRRLSRTPDRGQMHKAEAQPCIALHCQTSLSFCRRVSISIAAGNNTCQLNILNPILNAAQQSTVQYGNSGCNHISFIAADSDTALHRKIIKAQMMTKCPIAGSRLLYLEESNRSLLQ